MTYEKPRWDARMPALNQFVVLREQSLSEDDTGAVVDSGGAEHKFWAQRDDVRETERDAEGLAVTSFLVQFTIRDVPGVKIDTTWSLADDENVVYNILSVRRYERTWLRITCEVVE